MDSSVAEALNGLLARHDSIEDPVLLFEQASQVVFAGSLVLLFFLSPRRLRESCRRAAVAAGVSAAFALALGSLIATLVDRSRPFVADPAKIHLFAKHAADPGFPSDHATAAFAIAVAVLLRDRLAGGTLLVLATLVAIGRVALGVHYPTDVIAGALLGTAAALVMWQEPLRRLTDGLADWAGGLIDRVLPHADSGVAQG